MQAGNAAQQQLTGQSANLFKVMDDRGQALLRGHQWLEPANASHGDFVRHEPACLVEGPQRTEGEEVIRADNRGERNMTIEQDSDGTFPRIRAKSIGNDERGIGLQPARQHGIVPGSNARRPNGTLFAAREESDTLVTKRGEVIDKLANRIPGIDAHKVDLEPGDLPISRHDGKPFGTQVEQVPRVIRVNLERGNHDAVGLIAPQPLDVRALALHTLA